MNTDERERLKQIRRWRMMHVSANSDPYADLSRAFGEIDFLLALLDQYRKQFELLDDPQGLYSEARERIVSVVRDKCVEKVEQAVWLATKDFKSVLNEIQRRAIALAAATYVEAAVKKESLTPDQVEQENK